MTAILELFIYSLFNLVSVLWADLNERSEILCCWQVWTTQLWFKRITLMFQEVP